MLSSPTYIDHGHGGSPVYYSSTQPINPSDGNSGFLRAARAGNVEKVLEYLRSSIDINTSNANGLNALHLASKEGHVNIVQELLSRGANVNAATKKGNTALHIASLAGQEEVVKLLVKYNANINCQSQNGFSPLYMAAQENHLEVVKFLLANGANQSLATEDGFTPLAVSLQQGHDKVVAILLENDSKGSKVRLPALHIAAKKNDTKAAALLLQGDTQPDLNYKEGGFVNCTTKSGFTPLHIAAHYGNLEVAQLLISRGADVNYAASQNITPLHVSSKWGKENIVKLLLEKGAQIDAKTKDGLTPLHCAARSGHDQVVDLLLESGAPFGAKTKNGLSALHMAAQGDHVDAARILLYYKSTLVDDVSSDYLSALHVASHCGNYNVAKLLCERRADVNAKALNGFSCLHIACKKNRLKLVELLIANDADVEGKTESGLTSLHVAAFVGSHEIVVYLLQHGAQIDAVTIRGETPLHLATRNNQVDIVQTLLRYGAMVDAKAKEAQTCLHLATRLGNIEIVNLLLKANAFVDNETKDGYSSLHIAAKEGHEEIASLLIDHGANLNLFTKRNFSALHICSKYGNIKVANLLLQKGATPDIQGKNDLTPLHCAVHYNHSNVALLLLQHGASPHVTARNGYTPLHIAAKKNALDIAEMLLEYNANTNAQSTGGFTPLHLSCQDGHSDMTYLLLANHADANIASKCHLTSLHLCAQEDRVKCAEALVNKHADIDAQTLSGYTSLHVACHFGQINMVRYLLQLDANVNIETNLMFTPLHSAAQQGHVMIVKLLLENGASPNKTNKHGMTALSIAQRLGYISVVEELKVVTETTIASKHELITEERYKIQAPEVSHEEHPLTDSEDETVEDNIAVIYPEIGYFELGRVIDNLNIPKKTTKDMLGDASSTVHMQYLREGVLMTEAEENKLNQASFIKEETEYPMLAGKDHWTESRDNLHDQQTPIIIPQNLVADNETITKPRHGGDRFQYRSFLVSFLVDARGGAMRGCRHSGVRVIIPPKRASMPTRITCRFVKREKLTIPPPINEGEALAARVLEVGPVACKFLGPVILEIPHFASLRNREREIVVLRSDNGEKWTEHTGPITDDAVRDVIGDTVDSEDLDNVDDLHSRRITRIITHDFPRFFALITRIRQEVHFIDEQGGLLTSSIIPAIQAHIPEKALQKRIRVSLHVLPIASQLVQRSYGSRINVSPVVTVEPRRRKFHKPITLTIPLPTKSSSTRKHSQQHQHVNAYTSDSQTLRLLCSITGGTHAAQFDDITGHTPLTFSNDCATFTTTVSARFWLIDAQGVTDVNKLAHEIYREATSVPYMSRFIVFAKRHDLNEALVRIFCITDDKENKTLEMQEHFTEIAKSKEVEVVNGNSIYIDLQSNNLQTIIKTNEQLTLIFRAFRENRLPCVVRIRDQEQEATGRLVFSKDNGKLTSIQRTTSITMTNGQASSLSSTTIIDPQTLQTICNLNIVIPAYDKDLIESEERLRALHSVERDRHSESWKSDDMFRKGEIRLTDIARLLGNDWPALAAELELSEDEVTKIMDEFGENASLHMLRYWLKSRGTDATGNCLQQALRKIGKENIVHNCVFNIEWVTDAAEKELAKARLNSRGGSVDGIPVGGRRLDEGFESDDEYERRRHGKSIDLDDPYGTLSKQRSADIGEGRLTPTASSEFPSKKSPTKLGDFGIVNIVQEATPISPDDPPIQSHTEQTSTQQLAEQTSQMLDDLPPTHVGERLIKSKIIPEQARALANALKNAMVNPLRTTLIKKKSLETNLNEPPVISTYQPIVQSFSNPSSILIENSDHQVNELSVDSYESTSPMAITPPPAKPPRQNDESGSSSSIEINSSFPPAKPPRHFSVYKNEKELNILRQSNIDQFVQLQTSDSLKNIETFIVQPIRVAVRTDVPLRTELFDHSIKITSSIKQSDIVDQSTVQKVPSEIIQLATNLSKTLLQDIKKDFQQFDQRMLFSKLAKLKQQQTLKTSDDNIPSFLPSIVTTHISPLHSATRPLMFVSLDSESSTTSTNSPLLDIIKTKSTPLFTTSVTVTSPSSPLISSTTTVTNSDENLHSTSPLISHRTQRSDHSNSSQTTSKRNSFDSNDTVTYDNTIFLSQTMGIGTPTRSLLSDYDNLHGSYGSLNDDNQPTPTLTPPLPSLSTASSSMTTIYESLDNFPSSSSATTSQTYISAVSTFNTDGTRTPSQRFNSDISDEDLVESFDIDRSSQVSTPTIEVIEDNSEPIDEDDMTFLTEVLAQYNHNFHQQDNLETTHVQTSFNKEATLADKGEEPPSPSSSSSEPSSLLNSTSSFSSIFPSFLTSDITTIITLSTMPSKNSQITFQKLNQIPSTTTNLNENNPTHNLQQEKNDYANTSSIPQRRLPLPNKLTFEQNITNLIEKESPLLQSELLTAEHELSVLRSRLAVNEGVTAVTGSILESLKEQFESHHKTDRPTSSFDISPTNLLQYSSGIQTSPSLEALPDPLEIHYDGESPKNPYFVIKANNSFWLAQPINHSDVEKHLKKFSSPVMKHASIKLPEDFDFDDIDKDSISDENESSTIDRQEQLAEMKTIRSSSIIQPIDQFDKFEDKIDEIYSLIDSFKHHKLTPKIFHTLEKNIQDLKLIMHDIPCNKQDELRIEYEFDELENLFHQTTYQHEDYNLIELFEQNLNELQHIIEQIKTKTSPIQRDVIIEFENKLKSIQTKSKPRLIPENPVVTKDVFFEGDKISKIKKTSPSNIIRLIPEDPQINASSFYEGDIRRSFYHPPHPHSEHERKVLIPEKPLVSSEVFYEGDPQRSMFIERPNLSHPEYFSTPPVSIDHLRDIMSDLMLAASWSKKPRLEKQPTKDDVEIHAESFITTEEQHKKSPVCEITHEIENFSLIHPSILIEPNEEMVVIDKPDQESSDMAFAVVSPTANEKEQYDNLLIRTSVQIVEQVFNEIISEEQNQLYHQTAVNIVNDVLENILTKNDDELHSIKSSSSDSENEEESPEEYSPSDDEENEKLIPQISDQPYLFVTEVVTSKSTQELGNLVQELQVLEHQIHDIHILSSSSSSLSEDDQIPSLNLPIPQIATTKSVNELTTLVSELQTIEEQLEDKLTSPDKTNQSPISSKSFNELGGLINELKTVSNRLHEEIFTSNNIDLLSEDIAKYRRDSLPIITDQYLQKKEREQYEFNENQLVQEMVGQIIKEAQQILLAELSSNASQSTVKCVPTIIVDERRAPYHQLSATSISDDLDISHEDNTIDRTFELAAQLDYLRRMSRYENLMNQYDELQKSSVPKETFIDQNLKKEPSSSDEDNYETLSYQQLEITQDPINQRSTDSLMYHSTEDIEENTSTTIFDRVKSFVNKPIEIIQEVIENRFTTDHLSPQPPHHHFQSAYDLHDEEKSKLVRSPELYNMDNVIKHDHRSLSTNSQIQYRTLSESALAVDDSKRHSLTTATSNEASVEYLTTISKENSLEFMQLQRAPTPFDDVLEKESSPEHSESYNPPTSAFSDAFEPTSSCQRPLAIFTSNQQRIITDLEYQTVANDLVNQVLNDVVTELIIEQDNSSLSTKSDELSISSSTSSDDIDQIFQDQGELFINNKRYVHQESTSPKTSTRSSFSKILRRAQTDITDVDIVPSPRALNPPLIRRNSQSDTETYFHAITPTIHDYIPMDNSSSDEKSSAKTRHLSFKHNEKYSGEGEESSGGKERITQRRKRSNDNSNTYESPPIKNLAFKFETNDNFNRQESLDSPTIDSNEKNIFKILQESIFRTNLESFQIDLKFISQQKENLQEKTYSSTTKKSLSYYDYDGGSETDRDDSKILPLHQKVSIDMNVKNLLDELIETIHDDLTISSPSDVTTVIFNSNTMSLDEEDNSNLIDKEGLSSSSSSSSHTVIYHQQNLTSFVNTNAKQQSSINSNTKKKFHSYPGSLVPITSISSIPTTSTTFQSGKQQFDE